MTPSETFSAATASNLRQRLDETRTRIASVALRYGRDAGSVGLVAVSKGQPPERIRALAECGQRDFGENYLQEALPKLSALADLSLTWHFIGQLQANKTRPVAEHFHWVHTLDRERIAVRLSEQRPHYAPPLNICIQVRLADEAGKGGVTPDETALLARRIRDMPRLRLRGLMCIPPPRESFEQQREFFALLAQQCHALNAQGFALDALSMGMSGDLEAAVAAGATWVRIGTAIFGERPAK
jgi:PLP dependent protein